MDKYPDEFAKVVMDWAEAHKPKTNGEVARELLEEKFGIKMHSAFTECTFTKCVDTNISCKECPNNGFWDREYTGE